MDEQTNRSDQKICDHDYMHAHGIPHDHHHGHTHSHDFDGDHTHGQSATPMDELLALMKFMVKHNDAHAQELAELAQQLQDAGKIRAYRQIMDAVSDFDMVNAKLDAVVTDLSDSL